MKAIGWHAWYSDNREFDSKHIDWVDLPDDGLAIVVVFMGEVADDDGDTPYRQVYSGHDFYWTIPGIPLEVFCSDENPKVRYPGALVKRGRWMPTDEYYQYAEEAHNMKVRSNGDS